MSRYLYTQISISIQNSKYLSEFKHLKISNQDIPRYTGFFLDISHIKIFSVDLFVWYLCQILIEDVLRLRYFRYVKNIFWKYDFLKKYLNEVGYLKIYIYCFPRRLQILFYFCFIKIFQIYLEKYQEIFEIFIDIQDILCPKPEELTGCPIWIELSSDHLGQRWNYFTFCYSQSFCSGPALTATESDDSL